MRLVAMAVTAALGAGPSARDYTGPRSVEAPRDEVVDLGRWRELPEPESVPTYLERPRDVMEGT